MSKKKTLEDIKKELGAGHVLAKLLRRHCYGAGAAAAYLGMRKALRMGSLEWPNCEHVFTVDEQDHALSILLHEISSPPEPKK